MKFVFSVILISIFCGIQQFSQILCDDVALNSTVSGSGASGSASANDTGCEGVFCIIDKILSFIEGSSGSSDGYDYYYDGNNSGYDDYYYDMGSPVIEEIIIVPIPVNETAFGNLTSASWPSSGGWDYGDYNASSTSSSESNNDNSSLWSSLGNLFSNDGALGGLFGGGPSNDSASVPIINITSPSTPSAPSSSASNTSAPSITTTATSAPPLWSSSSGPDYGSGSGFNIGSQSGSGSGSSFSSSGGATSTSAPSTTAPTADTGASANTTTPDNGTMTNDV